MDICFINDSVFAGRALKGQLALYLVKNAYVKGYLKRIISNGYEESVIDSSIIKNAVPLSKFVNAGLIRIKKYLPVEIPIRYYSDRIFDNFASRRVVDCDIFFCLTPICAKSIEVAKRNGSGIVTRDSFVNPDFGLKILKHENEIYGIKNQHDFLKMRKMNNKCLQQSDWIFACSQYSKYTHITSGISEEKIIVINQGVDTKRFVPGNNHDEFRGIFVGGTVGPYKGVKYLLESWKGFAKNNQELLVCGYIEKVVKELFKRYTNRINMKLTGFVNPLEYYKQASVLIYPSLSEGFEKVTLEAMSCGLPIITTTNTGAAGIIKDGKEGFVVPIRDSKSIENHLMYLYENPSELKRMGKNARRLAEKFNWEEFSIKICNYLEMIYDER